MSIYGAALSVCIILASRPFMDRNVQNGTLVRGLPLIPQQRKEQKNLREIVLAVAGFILGGFFGVTMMCLFQINRDRHYISRKDDDRNEQEKH